MQKKILLILLFLLLTSTPILAQESFIGKVKNVKGSVFVIRQGTSLPLEKGMELYTEDIIKTESDSSTGIILQDNTIFSLGSETELSLNEFIFVPAEDNFSLFVKMIKGTFVYISGVIGKISPESVELETPVGIIAIRGTRLAAKIAAD